MGETEKSSAETVTVETVAAETDTTETVAAETVTAEAPRRVIHSKEFGGYFWGTGRRKRSVARVRARPGSGAFVVNGRAVDDFFSILRQQKLVHGPLVATDMKGKVDVYVNVKGGGITGQTGAVMMGLARALTGIDPSVEPVLRSDGYLTRDSRMVERKKYGRRGARRSFQFSKR